MCYSTTRFDTRNRRKKHHVFIHLQHSLHNGRRCQDNFIATCKNSNISNRCSWLHSGRNPRNWARSRTKKKAHFKNQPRRSNRVHLTYIFYSLCTKQIYNSAHLVWKRKKKKQSKQKTHNTGTPTICLTGGILIICPREGLLIICPTEGILTICPTEGILIISPTKGIVIICPTEGILIFYPHQKWSFRPGFSLKHHIHYTGRTG